MGVKEIEYFGEARTGDFYKRVEGLIDDELTKLETEYDVQDTGEGTVARVKNLRTAILPDMVHNNISAPERHRRWKQLAACYYVQQMSHYPRNYVRTSEPNLVEHILETVERFEEDFTDKATVHSPLHAVIEVGTAIEVSSRRDRKTSTDPVMEGIRTQLTQMLSKLATEAKKV